MSDSDYEHPERKVEIIWSDKELPDILQITGSVTYERSGMTRMILQREEVRISDGWVQINLFEDEWFAVPPTSIAAMRYYTDLQEEQQ